MIEDSSYQRMSTHDTRGAYSDLVSIACILEHVDQPADISMVIPYYNTDTVHGSGADNTYYWQCRSSSDAPAAAPANGLHSQPPRTCRIIGYTMRLQTDAQFEAA